MQFPDSAKNAIASAFYDKKFKVLQLETHFGAEGDAVNTSQEIGEYSGNVRFSNFEKLREIAGLVDEIDIAISCAPEVATKTGDFVEYAGKKYLIIKILPRDSHLMIVGRLNG